ncbi:MAG: DsbA family protein [Pseudomonadota bacterium]
MKQILIAAICALGFGLSGPALQAQEMTPEQKAAIDAQIRAYILANPEVIVEAMQVLEQRQEEETRNTDRVLISRLEAEIFDDGYSYVGGNPDGDVTLVEFLDYRCGFCKRAHEGVQALVEADPNLRYVVKEFPILGPESTFASRIALAAKRQGDDKYALINDALMTHEGDLNNDTVLHIAASVGLDMDQLRVDAEDPAIAEHIRTTYALARRLQINGTPGFVIGDEIVRGFVPYDALRELVEDTRARG